MVFQKRIYPVKEIQEAYACGEAIQTIAKRYHISDNTVTKIIDQVRFEPGFKRTRERRKRRHFVPCGLGGGSA